MYTLSGGQVVRLMRQNAKTIRGIAEKHNITMTRVQYVRTHGVQGEAFVRDWLDILTK